ELAKRANGESGPIADGAVQEHRRAVVRDRLLDPRFERPAGNVDRLGQMSLVPLAPLSHVTDCNASVAHQLMRLCGRDLVDLVLYALQQLAVRRHLERGYPGGCG